MSDAFRLGIAGLGTVGTGVLRLLREHAALIEARAGRAIEVVAVSARDRSRDRGIDLGDMEWCDDPVDLARLDGVDAVVEMIGGTDGPALDLARECFGAGRSLVTANKAMIAQHGLSLTEQAEGSGMRLGEAKLGECRDLGEDRARGGLVDPVRERALPEVVPVGRQRLLGALAAHCPAQLLCLPVCETCQRL